MIEELTTEELADWLAYTDEYPTGHAARDLQQEVFRIRLLLGFDGKIDEAPGWRWPYVERAPSLAEIRQAQAQTRKVIAAAEAKNNGTAD